jgi:hypothetical protein
MRRCDEHEADVVVDGQGYIITSLAELKAVEKRLSGMAGVQWLARGRTQARLKAIDAAKRGKLGLTDGAPDAQVEL